MGYKHSPANAKMNAFMQKMNNTEKSPAKQVGDEKGISKKDYKRNQEHAMSKAEKDAGKRYMETPAGQELFSAMNTSRIKEGSKPDGKGRVGVFNPETQMPSTTKFTTIKDSKANARAYDKGLNTFLKTDTEYQARKKKIYDKDPFTI